MALLDWLVEHEALLAWTGVFGAILLVGSLGAIPIIVAWMPEDYFVRISSKQLRRRPFRQILHILKTILGAALVISGLVLLLLPGQGLLTLIIGLSLIDFPGKHALQIRIVSQPRVSESIQWVRRKVHHKPLIFPHGE
jgi:hypothetical protein